MKRNLITSSIVIILLLFLIPNCVFAGQIPTTELQMPSGQTGTTGQGDYVSSTGGLNTYLSYFIEVPTGATNLYVDLYDADVGQGACLNNNDRDRPNQNCTGFNTSVTYTLLTPTGATQVTKICDSGLNPCTADNGAWTNLAMVVAPAAGHWELRVDMGAGDDLNGFAIRAHDGDITAGGTEYNLYADSFIDIGLHNVEIQPAPTPVTYSNIFPFITSGCYFSTRDWDYDDNGTAPPEGTISVTSRSGVFTYANPSVSGGTLWYTTPSPYITGWTTDDTAGDYGIWSSNITIGRTGSPAITANYATIYIGQYNAAATPPTSQPQANTFRMYFPTDGGGAPPKPYLTQILASPIPTVITGKTTRVNIQVTITNPTPFDITFSATNLVTANVPGPTCPAATNSACYAGSSYSSVTQGVITGQPAAGATGNITWNPGTVYAGTSASLTYAVNVAPTATGNRIVVTGIPTSNGTRAVYVDETGNTTQTRATYTFGPLCELAVTAESGATGAKRFMRWREVIQ